MISLSPFQDLVHHADQRGMTACDTIERDIRSKQGQFFSPVETARYLASCFTDTSFSDTLCLHDPGAGSGILTAAFVESLLERIDQKRVPAPTHVILLAGERDPHFLPVLHDVLHRCKQSLEHAGIPTRVIIHEGDWIRQSVESLENTLLPTQPSDHIPSATHTILNPPYKKLPSSSSQRHLLSRIGIETTNLYSAFVWLGILHLQGGGELSAITPRSFCNGPYFKPFRQALLNQSHIRLLHQIEARNDVFQRDNVLQENIIYLLEKKATTGTKTNASPPGKVLLACGDFTSPTQRRIPLRDVVHPKDPEFFIHLATKKEDKRARDFVMLQDATLADLGINISTGPVVDFRLRQDLTRHQKKQTYPLIYPHLLKAGKVLPPPAHSDDAENARQCKKPVAIRETVRTSKFLVQRGYYVLTKRFTSKEEKRRIVACVLDPKDFPDAKIGIENHINYFHANGQGLTKKMAQGLADYLNSPEVDEYFRQFNGHTQVNATDLRNLRYPTKKQLAEKTF